MTMLSTRPAVAQDGHDDETRADARGSASSVVDPPPRPSPRTVVTGAQPPSVLLVEDEPDLRRLVRRHLERSRAFRVAGEAGDGTEALRLAAADEPDIVLLDIVMPTMDGREALPRLLRIVPRSMVIVLSALSAVEEEEPALVAGAFAYVEKTHLGAGFCDLLTDLHQRFRRALSGETVWAPGTSPR